MQPSTIRRDNSYISLGERRGNPDLARFSLDLSWAREVSDSARSRSYPSPPMSGSPPLPPRRNLDASDRGHGSYGSTGQDVFRGAQNSQAELAEQSREPLLRAYQEPLPTTSYSTYPIEDIPQQLQYQQHRPQPQVSQQQLPSYNQQPFSTYSAPNRSSIGETADYSPKAQRKTKGHVASACVPCKRAHLRCDAQRPCSRCMGNGKEDSCVDVQHKKRGRPRLRDEREPRYEALGPNYPLPPPESSMRRPLSLYTPGDASVAATFSDPLHRSTSYRVLKSQGGPQMGNALAPRYLEHASSADANLFGVSIPPPSRLMGQPQALVCAYLTMEMQIAKATQGFGEIVGIPSIGGRKLHDLVSANDREKVYRLQRLLEDERRGREPNYLPPIYPKHEEDRVIQSVAFGPGEMDQIRPERQELLTFQGPDGQQRSFQVQLGLAKKESTYFVALHVNVPKPQPLNQSSSLQYSRDSQYAFQASHLGFAQSGASPFMPNPAFNDPHGDVYRTTSHLGSTMATPTAMPPFPQPQGRPQYFQGQNSYQSSRSEILQQQLQPQSQRQHELQLPPIRDQRSESSRDTRRGDNQGGRVDIGGLLEKPGMGRGN